MPVANVSQHLQALRRAHLAEARPEGTYVYYRLADERVVRLLQALREVGEAHLAELDQILRACRQERGVFADEAIEQLRRHGRRARRLDLGYPDWWAAGLPVNRPAAA